MSQSWDVLLGLGGGRPAACASFGPGLSCVCGALCSVGRLLGGPRSPACGVTLHTSSVRKLAASGSGTGSETCLEAPLGHRPMS